MLIRRGQSRLALAGNSRFLGACGVAWSDHSRSALAGVVGDSGEGSLPAVGQQEGARLAAQKEGETSRGTENTGGNRARSQQGTTTSGKTQGRLVDGVGCHAFAVCPRLEWSPRTGVPPKHDAPRYLHDWDCRRVCCAIGPLQRNRVPPGLMLSRPTLSLKRIPVAEGPRKHGTQRRSRKRGVCGCNGSRCQTLGPPIHWDYQPYPGKEVRT